MSGQRVRKGSGITRQHGDALAEVRRAIEAGRLAVDPSAAIILADIEAAVRAHAHNAAIVRVRVKNLGTPPSERARRGRAPKRTKAQAAACGGRGTDWSQGEMDLLAELWPDATLTIAMIALTISERFGVERTRGACVSKAQSLHLRQSLRPRPYPVEAMKCGNAKRENGYTKRPLLAAVRRVKERREADGRAA